MTDSSPHTCKEAYSGSRFGDNGEEVTPVPIPNTEVKLFSADGSWGIAPVRVGRRQAMTLIIKGDHFKKNMEYISYWNN